MVGRVGLVVAIAACGDNLPGTTSEPGAPTFHADVAPILNARCQSCHQPGSIAPFSLVTYDDASEVAPAMRNAVVDGVMPPWGANATADCMPRLPWRAELALTEDEESILVRWIDGDTPEGEPPATPPVLPSPQRLSDVDIDVGFTTPFVVAGTSDLSRCFPLDVTLPAGTWIRGFEVVPGNTRVVHHVNVIADPTRSSLAQRNPDGTVPCSYQGVDQQQGLGFWTAGSLPVELPADFGIYLPDGSSLVVQVHYHPISVPQTDDTHVRLAVTDIAPRYAVIPGIAVSTFERGAVILPGERDPTPQPELFIPAGAARHSETVELTIPSISPYTGRAIPRVHLLGISSHMHLLGVEARTEVQRASGTECLLHEDFDYRWQRFYDYDAPLANLPTIEPGDVVRVRCTYDNSLANPALVAALATLGLVQPIDVRVGWRTLDEMCQATLSIAYEWPGQPF